MVVRRCVVMGIAGCALLLVLAARPASYPTRFVIGQGIVQPAFPTFTQKATITWWDWSVNDDIIVKRFEQRYPSIHVIPRNVGGGVTEYTKLLTAIRAGAGAPDVVQLVQSALPQFIAGGGLRDLAPLGAQRYRPYILPWAWHLVTQGTRVYAIPVDAGPSVFFYNSTIFKAYGLRVPTTWSQYLSAAATLHKANPRLYMTYFPPNNVEFFLNMAWAAGARPFVQTGANGNAQQLHQVFRHTEPDGSTKDFPHARIRAIWTEDLALSTVINDKVALVTGRAELAKAIQDGLAAHHATEPDLAMDCLDRARKLAEKVNEDSVLAQLDRIYDPDTGTFQLDRMSTREEMGLDIESTKTTPLSRGQ